MTGARWRIGLLVAFLGSWRSPENAPKSPRHLYFCRAAPLLILSKLPLTAPRPDLLKIEGVWEYSGQFVVYCPRVVFEHMSIQPYNTVAGIVNAGSFSVSV